MSFALGNPPTDPADLTAWVVGQLQELATEVNFATARAVEFLNVAPLKPREGMLTGADGVNWNPGAGKGVYCYYTGAWRLLG